jgi:hypothetical protein
MALLAFSCAPFLPALFAWPMANRDLREMDAGIKDPSGRGLVLTGKYLAIVNIAAAAVLFLFLILSAAANQ